MTISTHSIFRAGVMRGGALLVCLLLLAPAGLAAQATSEEVAARLQALEERIRALEAELAALKAAQGTPPAVAPAPVAAVAAPAGAPGGPSGQLPVYGGQGALAKILNPDISVVGDFVGAAGKNSVNPFPSLEMHESEVGFQAIIDPYARGDFFLSFGHEGVELEEGYITFTSLPAGLLLKAGKRRSDFGKVNTLHNHTLPWIDRPLVTENLLAGEEGINDAGVSVSRLLPAPGDTFLEVTAEVLRGDSEGIFESSRRSDVAVVGHLKGYRDLTENTNLELGGSIARGHNDFGSDFVTQLYGFDATLRWKPLRRSIYHSFIARTELTWSRRREPLDVQSAFGYFTSLDYQLGRRWFLGGRYDWSERAESAALHDSGGSVILTYWPSEFSQVRGQLRRTRYAENSTAYELLFQLLFSLGAHGAHPF